jgi:D-alanyl-D-alanine carboxypeptidase
MWMRGSIESNKRRIGIGPLADDEWAGDFYDSTMNHYSTSHSSARRHVAHALVAATAAGLLLAATACSSDGDAVTPSTGVAPTTSAPPPTSTAVPSTSVAPPTTAATDEGRQAMLANILDSHHAAGEFVGARIALLDRDGTVTEVANGTTTVDPTSAPVDLEVAWNVGSVTKTFVAVVALQLADEGKIDLDAGINGYFPDLAEAEQITPRQLLQHTSGFGEYNDKPAVLNDAHRVWTPGELIAVAEAAGRVGEPGGPFHYSNTNYVMLGEIIRQVTGHLWDDEVRTRIVEPLGMTNTSVLHGELPIGYKPVDGAFVDATYSMDPSTGGAAGALQSTGHDLLLFAAALAHGTLLSTDSQTAMRAFIPGEDYSQFGIVHGYGLGLEQYATDAIAVVGHMGTGEAQSAFIGYDPEHGTAVAVMTNTAVAGPQAFMAVEALIAANQAG